MRTPENPLGLTPFDAAEYLDSEEMIAVFLTDALEDGNPDVILHAISTAARARGMMQLARDSGLGRESLYKALAPGAKPRYDTIFRVMNALGVRLTAHAAHTAVPSALDALTMAKTQVKKAPKPRARGAAPAPRKVMKRGAKKSEAIGAPAARR